MWHKAIWKGHQMRLELTHVGLLAELANHYTTRGALIRLVMDNFHGRLCLYVDNNGKHLTNVIFKTK